MLCFINYLNRNAEFTLFLAQNLSWVEIAIDLKCKSKFRHESEHFISHSQHCSVQSDLCLQNDVSLPFSDWELAMKEKGCAALKRVTICLECLFQYFLMWKKKHIRTNFLAFCQSASLLPQGASCGNSLNRNYTAHPVLNGALTFILMCECCMEWNFIYHTLYDILAPDASGARLNTKTHNSMYCNRFCTALLPQREVDWCFWLAQF